MRRLLGYLALAAAVAFAVAWLANRQGSFAFEFEGWRISTSAGLALALAVLFALVAILLARLLGAVLSGPGALMAWWRGRRRRRGEDALSRGLVAAAAGDLVEVRRAASRARALYGRAPLGLLLTAQAAALEGDGEAQRAAYSAMLEHEETTFLGLRGLFLDAMAREDLAAAKDLAARAHALKPRAGWAANALFDLSCAAGEWTDAKTALDGAVKAKLIPADVARRRRAVLLAAEAQAAEAGEPARALSLALSALDLAPGLAPAAALAARRLAVEGKSYRAEDVVETAWAQSPHPDLAAAYAAIKPRETAPERAGRLLALARLNRSHFESRLLEAEQNLVLERWSDARRVLAPLAGGFASARVCTLMAEIEQAQRQDAGAAHGWLSRAVRAPRDAEWRCNACGWSSPKWQAVCGHCRSFDSLSWSEPASSGVEPYAPSALPGEADIIEANALQPSASMAVPPRPDDPGPGGERFDPPARPQPEGA